MSIAKGGMVCKINTRATIIAATNPCKMQKWDPNYDLQANTGIVSSLLSRFDLIFIMLDEHDVEDDLMKAEFVLNRSCVEPKPENLQHQLWSEDKLRDYINFIQRVFEPYVSEEAELLIQSYYQYLRMNPKVNKDRKTVRMFESLIRMTEAHARLLMKSCATLFDAVNVIILMEHTLMTDLYNGGFLPPVIFDGKNQYREVRDDLLYKLGLDLRSFTDYDEEGELKKRRHTPSPIKRIEDSLFMNNLQSFDLSFDMNSSYMSQTDDGKSCVSQNSSKAQSLSKLTQKYQAPYLMK